MQAALQKAGVPFNKAMGVSKRDLVRASLDPQWFDRLVRELTLKAREGRMNMSDKYEHAFGNAKGWYEEIRDAYRAFNLDREEFDVEQERETAEAVEERMRESVLSVQVREPWHDPGADGVKPSEYEILLTTGGPALRVWGELDYGEPDGAQLQMQDWGVPWREVWPCEVEEHRQTSTQRWIVSPQPALIASTARFT